MSQKKNTPSVHLHLENVGMQHRHRKVKVNIKAGSVCVVCGMGDRKQRKHKVANVENSLAGQSVPFAIVEYWFIATITATQIVATQSPSAIQVLCWANGHLQCFPIFFLNLPPRAKLQGLF